LYSALPSRPFNPSSLRQSLVTLLGPVPDLNAILKSARIGPTPDIQRHRHELMGYRDKVVALLNLLEGSLATPGTKPITSARQAILAPTAA
jgi:hypothetical protein